MKGQKDLAYDSQNEFERENKIREIKLPDFKA